MKKMLSIFLCSLAFTASAAIPMAPLPSDSILQIDSTFTNQDGRNFKLGQRRGKPQVISMFYTSCPYMCPLMIDSAKAVEHSMSASELGSLSVLLVSIDPVRDTPKALMSIVNKRKIDTRRWTLARTDEKGVRLLAGVLGIRYRALSNGEFNHTSVLILLDADGRILARTENLGNKPDPLFLAAVKKAVALKATH